MSKRKKRDEETSPFPLERGKSVPPPAIAGLSDTETSGERTGPFLLERGKSSPDHPVVEAPAESESDSQSDEADGAPRPVPQRLTRNARVARRRIAITLGFHTLVLAVMAAISIVRWSKGLATPPELALAVLWGGVALIHLRAGVRFGRLGRRAARDAHLLVGALSDLRTVIVLKAVFLFLALTLLCFSLSMVISLVASI